MGLAHACDGCELSVSHTPKTLPVYHTSQQYFTDLISRSVIAFYLLDITANLCFCPPICKSGIVSLVLFLSLVVLELNETEFKNLRDLGNVMYFLPEKTWRM